MTVPATSRFSELHELISAAPVIVVPLTLDSLSEAKHSNVEGPMLVMSVFD